MDRCLTNETKVRLSVIPKFSSRNTFVDVTLSHANKGARRFVRAEWTETDDALVHHHLCLKHNRQTSLFFEACTKRFCQSFSDNLSRPDNVRHKILHSKIWGSMQNAPRGIWTRRCDSGRWSFRNLHVSCCRWGTKVTPNKRKGRIRLFKKRSGEL